MTIGDFANQVLLYCALMDCSVTSWFRTKKRNAQVGGIDYSLHRFGLAVDVVYDEGRPNIEYAQEVAKRLNLYVYREDDHDHVRPLKPLDTE